MRLEISGMEFLYVKDIMIHRKVNTHAVCEVKLLIAKEFTDSVNVCKDLISKTISLIAIDDLKGIEKTIFSGYIEKVQLDTSVRRNYIILKCYSNSKKDDIEKYTNLFQNIEKTIGNMIENLSFVSDITFLEKEIQTTNIYDPILQNEETKFEFLKRMIRKQNKICMAESLLASTKIWVGNRKGNQYQLKEDCFEMLFDMGSEQVNISIHNEFYELGDQIQILSKQYYIVENKIRYKDGICYCDYILIDDYNKIVWEENQWIDRKLLGIVVENKDKEYVGRLQIKFQEEKQGRGENYWYKVLSPYVSNDTGFYMMPSKGDTVIVQFTDNIEPYVIGSIREKGHENFENPNHLFIKNEFGKELNMTEKEINLVSLFNKVFLSLSEEKIEISNGNTGIYIEKDRITLQNENSLFVIDDKLTLVKDDGGEVIIEDKIKMNTKESSVTLSSNIELQTKENVSIKASNIKAESSNIKIK